MIELEAKTKITPYQLSLMIMATGFGAQIVLSPQKLIEKAETSIIVSIVVGGILFLAITLIMLKIGMWFPKDTLVEYLPKLWGRAIGTIIIWWYAAVLILQSGMVLVGFSKALTLFMFDKTPCQVVGISMLALTIYCAMQSTGTIVRVVQITFFGSMSIIILMWSLTIFNFRLENLQPFLSKGFTGVLTTVLDTWSMYSGYEIVMLILPLVCRDRKNLVKSTTLALLVLIVLFEFIFISIIGVMTAKSAASYVYPTIITMRAVELPGTFIERLENYLLLAWVPAVFDTLVVMVYAATKVLAIKYRYADHQMLVVLFCPIIFMIMVLIQGAQATALATKVLNWLGLSFSLGIVPISFILAWRKKRGVSGACERY